ncbi:hypothetical protein, partial [Salmonella enterica]|uniref:hypothetical protein n=1 Tax=Salmonella enterica TaxID=28901 RepID=UPI0020C540F0
FSGSPAFFYLILFFYFKSYLFIPFALLFFIYVGDCFFFPLGGWFFSHFPCGYVVYKNIYQYLLGLIFFNFMDPLPFT